MNGRLNHDWNQISAAPKACSRVTRNLAKTKNSNWDAKGMTGDLCHTLNYILSVRNYKIKEDLFYQCICSGRSPF